MKTESDLKTKFVKDLRSVDGWYATRIEDQYTVGRPDILVAVPWGPTLMIEAKVVKHQIFGPTPRQWIELQRFVTAVSHGGRRSLVLGFKEGRMYLCDAADQVRLGDCLKSDMDEPPHIFIVRFLRNA